MINKLIAGIDSMKFLKEIFSCLLIIATANSVAQVNNFAIGPEGGPGVGILWDNSDFTLGRKALLTGISGYTFQYNFTKIIAIKTGIDYERKGDNEKTPAQPSTNIYDPSFSTQLRNKFDYMTLPVLIRANFGGRVKFFINAGPYLAVLMREISAVPPYPDKNGYNNTAYFKRFDTGLTTGLGVSIPLGNMFAFSIEARNDLGLYNINNKPQPGFNAGPPTKTNTTNLIFGFSYKLVTRKAAHKQKTAKV